MTAPVRVGLVGAGPWARMVHAPLLAAGPETELAGVWSRTADHAESLAAEHGVTPYPSFDALLDDVEAVALAVVPAAQPDLAVRAAQAGKAVLLEKPLGLDVTGARRIADAVAEHGVGSLMLLTYRFADVVREFLADVDTMTPTGARACFISGAFLGGAFAGGWRLEHGALLDVGPHILDLVETALGPVVEIQGHGDPRQWVGLLVTHESGALSEVTLSCASAIEPSRTEVEVYGRDRSCFVDARSGARAASFARVRAEFAAVARSGDPHPCDASRGLAIQELVARAERALVK
ncbi:MAG: Gfo/Idh/MocA family oxidoreductase [Acidimicrobiia bacterium]|nr:Gfo/Idh/MocA family oxidoreductase [Acidimicrobiia bacterium]